MVHHTSSCGAVDKASSYRSLGHAFESRSEPLFLLNFLLIGGVDVCPPHVQTVSTSLMSRLVKWKFKRFKSIFYLAPRRYVIFWSFRWFLKVDGAFFDHITLYFSFSGQVKLLNPVELILYWNPIPDSCLKIRLFRIFSLVKWK